MKPFGLANSDHLRTEMIGHRAYYFTKGWEGTRLQNSRIFCERERQTIFERKAGASEKTARENGERRFTRPAGV